MLVKDWVTYPDIINEGEEVDSGHLIGSNTVIVSMNGILLEIVILLQHLYNEGGQFRPNE